jgi:hypothetical protein
MSPTIRLGADCWGHRQASLSSTNASSGINPVPIGPETGSNSGVSRDAMDWSRPRALRPSLVRQVAPTWT